MMIDARLPEPQAGVVASAVRERDCGSSPAASEGRRQDPAFK